MTRPLCFKHKIIQPNLNEYSVCLECDYRVACIKRNERQCEAILAFGDNDRIHICCQLEYKHEGSHQCAGNRGTSHFIVKWA